jgi:hypothetical protein
VWLANHREDAGLEGEAARDRCLALEALVVGLPDSMKHFEGGLLSVAVLDEPDVTVAAGGDVFHEGPRAKDVALLQLCLASHLDPSLRAKRAPMTP